MLNPDGVIVGNHRTCICGNDLNRQYLDPAKTLHPSIFALSDLVKRLTLQKPDSVFAYFDFHGHSLMKNVFMYGPEFPIFSLNYYKVKILPKIIAQITPMFRYQACSYTIPKSKLGTARAVFSMEYGVTHCYTLEASYACYLNSNKQSVSFNEDGYLRMGAALIEGLYGYKKILEEEDINLAAMQVKQDDSPQTIMDFSENEGAYVETSPERSLEKFEYGISTVTNSFNKLEIRNSKVRKTLELKKGDSISMYPSEKNFQEKKTKILPKLKKQRTRSIIPTSEEQTFNTAIVDMIDETKNNPEKDFSLNYDLENIENISKGESDMGDPEDDFQEDEMKMLQENIIQNIKEFMKISKDETIDFRNYKLKHKISKKILESRPNIQKHRRLLPSFSEKEQELPLNIDNSFNQDSLKSQSPPQKNILTLNKNSRRNTNWIPRFKQKVPLMPKEVQMIVDKPTESPEILDLSTALCIGSYVGPKNALRKYLINAHIQKKKQLEELDQIQKYSGVRLQKKQGFNLDQIQSIKSALEMKKSSDSNSIFRPLSDYLIQPKPRPPGTSSTYKSNKSLLVETESRFAASRDTSLKDLLERKCRPRPPLVRSETHSFDQKAMKESLESLTLNEALRDRYLYEKEQEWKAIQESSYIKKVTQTNAVPCITIIQAQMSSEYAANNGVASLKKNKNLPISYVSYKNNIFLRRKIRNRKPEAP